MSWRVSAAGAAGLVAAVLLARLGQDAETGAASWDAARASGFAGYLLLWASVLLGFMLHMRVRIPGVPMSWWIESHRMVSALALSFVAGHVAALLVDPVVRFSPVEVLVPFTSGYRPLAVGLGVLAAWLLVAVLASTALHAHIPWTAWRRLHTLSFPCWLLALVHGLLAGTDTGSTVAVAVYAVTGALVAALSVVRLLGRGRADAVVRSPRQEGLVGAAPPRADARADAGPASLP
jgi:sulfoxide reductase heme-binding subunit YedZ